MHSSSLVCVRVSARESVRVSVCVYLFCLSEMTEKDSGTAV